MQLQPRPVRQVPRRRRAVSARRARRLRWLGFRYCPLRDAYVLRFVGELVGPVYQADPEREAPLLSAPAEPKVEAPLEILASVLRYHDLMLGVYEELAVSVDDEIAALNAQIERVDRIVQEIRTAAGTQPESPTAPADAAPVVPLRASERKR
jgi:hypothetical protein